jgi:death-on-curing protein
MNWRWLGARIITAIHHRQIQRHGGSFGLRDAGMLESALARPENLAAYSEPTAFQLAASYAFGLARNHPFIDGNKRNSFVAAALFLQLNGQNLEAPQAEAAVVFLRLAAGEIEEAELAEWFRRNCTPADTALPVAEQISSR